MNIKQQMSTLFRASTLSDDSPLQSRRLFLNRGGALAASAGCVAALGAASPVFASTNESGKPSDHAAGKTLSLANDRCIIEQALAMEYRAIATYELAASSKHLDMAALDTIYALQSNHEIHVEVLETALKRLCKTAEIESIAATAKAEDLPPLNSQQAILEIAAELERSAADTYLNALPRIKCDRLNKVVARLAADNSMHWTLLRVSMGVSTPARAMSFGA